MFLRNKSNPLAWRACTVNIRDFSLGMALKHWRKIVGKNTIKRQLQGEHESDEAP